MLIVNDICCSLDFILGPNTSNPAVISFYDRSQQTVRSIAASLTNRCEILIEKDRRKKTQYINYSGFDVYISPIISGKEKFYHAIALSKDINTSILIAEKDQLATSLYDMLMKNFNLPLMREWSEELLNHFLYKKMLSKSYETLILGTNSITSELSLKGQVISLNSLLCYSLHCSENSLRESVEHLFQSKRIAISTQEQNKLSFKDMDSYFSRYGHTIVSNLEKTIVPLSELKGNIDSFCLKHKRLYPQQAAQVNGVVERLNKSNFCIINHGMGTGKTIEGASICEAYFLKKWLKQNPSNTLTDAYKTADNIKYRNIIMCPGHLVKKWAEEIKSEIPYAKVTMLNDISQLIEIKNKGIKRTDKEYFIISKDFAKLSYQLKPTPFKRRAGHIMKKVCVDCNSDVYTATNICSCGSSNLKIKRTSYYDTGMTCPHCKNILLPYKTNRLQDYLSEDEVTRALDYDAFTVPTQSNSRCYHCGEELWVPHIENIGENKHNHWYRATHYTNKAHKGKRTVWVHRKYDELYFSEIGERPLNVIDTDVYQGTRKVSPGYYIKKQLKGFFDIAIFDEAHLYKSGDSAQGNTMHSLVKASKKQLALTGTIAGGYASHVFYLLYRLNPRKLKANGYNWTDVMKFIEKYGKLEKTFEVLENEGRFNVSSRGRQKGSPKEKPGISPLLFMDFLLDCTVYLDLTDMSRYLPKLKEYVEAVSIDNIIDDSEFQMLQNYRSIIDELKKAAKEPGMGSRGLLSSMLQFSLSYLDKPYGISPIKSPITGKKLAIPDSYDCFNNPYELLSKEKRLVEIVTKEIKEGRNCVVYAEFTASPETCVTQRLKDIIELHCGLKGKVEVLESSYPSASKREEWMHKKATEGIKVFITNPRNVETGLDFCFKVDGIEYNYPTLIFYQLGYSLFTIWQASRRHYRLNQRNECRTYYMCVKGTIQEAIISLIANKMNATAAIQGKFSTEGLTAMAEGVDVKLKLAQALSDMDSSSGADLQGMFDAINDTAFDDSAYSSYRPMLTLKELLGTDVFVEDLPEDIQDATDIFDMFDMFLSDFNDRYAETNKSVEGGSIIGQVAITVTISESKKAKKVAPEGQISLFSI